MPDRSISISKYFVNVVPMTSIKWGSAMQGNWLHTGYVTYLSWFIQTDVPHIHTKNNI